MDDLLSGERIQDICDTFLIFNPVEVNPYNISDQRWKHFFNKLEHGTCVYIKGEHLSFLIDRMDWFSHPVKLVVHNSDQRINDLYLPIVHHPNCLHLFAQNLELDHPKASPIPIGMANSMWRHGNLYAVQAVRDQRLNKTNDVYFQFSIGTNPAVRQHCYEELKDVYLWCPHADFTSYLRMLATYKYSICPEGNGSDTHRMWECLALGVVPILLNTPFTRQIKKLVPEVVVVDSWKDVPNVLEGHVWSRPRNVTLSDVRRLVQNC